jgi:hypothetical protein
MSGNAINPWKFQYVAISTLFLVLLSSCSSEYPVDRASCKNYGDTLLEACFWFRNAPTIFFGISAIIYGLGLWALNRWNKMNKRGAFFLFWVWFLFGIPPSLLVGALAQTQFENFLVSL